MSDKSKVKYISDIELNDSDVLVKKPFKVKTENQRRFVRIQISAPVSMKNLKNDFKNILNEEVYTIEGTIFNISSSGVLVELNETVALQDYLLMKFTLQEREVLDSVLGVVKRIDSEKEGNLVGIEFLSPNSLQDSLSQAEIEILQENIPNFDDSIHSTLEKYLYEKIK